METRVKIFLTVGVFIGILVYDATSLLLPSYNQDFLSFYKYSQFIVSAFLAISFINWEFLHKIILGKDYVAGKYTGTSKYYIIRNMPVPEEDKNKKSNIQFEITQTIFNVKVSGQTIEENGDIRSSWHGTATKNEGRSYYFALHLDKHITEVGIYKLTFLDNGKVVGFYYSGDPSEKYTFEINAQKKDKRSAL